MPTIPQQRTGAWEGGEEVEEEEVVVEEVGAERRGRLKLFSRNLARCGGEMWVSAGLCSNHVIVGPLKGKVTGSAETDRKPSGIG